MMQWWERKKVSDARARVGFVAYVMSKLEVHFKTRHMRAEVLTIVDDVDFVEETWKSRQRKPWAASSDRNVVAFALCTQPVEIDFDEEPYEPRVWPQTLELDGIWEKGDGQSSVERAAPAQPQSNPRAAPEQP